MVTTVLAAISDSVTNLKMERNHMLSLVEQKYKNVLCP